MITNPRLSVVVPVFNEERSIEPLYEAICSALSDEPDWELVEGVATLG